MNARRVTVAVGLSVLLLSGGVVAVNFSDARTSTQTVHVHSRPRRLARVFIRNFALFSRAGALGRVAAATPAVHAPPGLVNRFGIDPTQGKTVQLSSAFSLTVFPGASGLCLVWPQPSSAGHAFICGPPAGADDGSAWGVSAIATSTGPDYAVFGLVPDTNTSVSITSADGSVQTVPVSANMFFANIGSNPDFQLLVDRDASGQLQSYHGIPDVR